MQGTSQRRTQPPSSQIRIGKVAPKRGTIMANQSNRDAPKMKTKANFFKCQQKKKSIPPIEIRKGKRVVKLSKKNTKHMDVDWEMGIHLQEEIIMDILSRLPVQSLLRFKCVSKPWKKLISEPYFTRKHLNHAKNNQNFQKFLGCRTFPKDGVLSYYCSSLSSIQLVESVQKLDCPSDFKPSIVEILCCFDGLSIMKVHNYFESGIILLLLWNPFTRESIVLPNPEFPPKGYYVYGMGYDSTTDDYKILKIDVLGNKEGEVSTELLSLKKGSWSKIDKYSRFIFYLFSGRNSLAFVHGSFHWLIFFHNISMISFSISNEVYKEIPLPERMHLEMSRGLLDVSVLEGMLCIFYTSIQRWGTFKLWLMKDYGVEASWTELITLQDTRITLTTPIPDYMFTNGEVLLRCMDREDQIVFMTSKGQVGLWLRLGLDEDGFVSTESLISPKLLI